MQACMALLWLPEVPTLFNLCVRVLVCACACVLPAHGASRRSLSRRRGAWSRTGWTGSGSSPRRASWAWCRWRASPASCSGSYWHGNAAARFYHPTPERVYIEREIRPQSRHKWLKYLLKRDQIYPLAQGFELKCVAITSRWILSICETPQVVGWTVGSV